MRMRLSIAVLERAIKPKRPKERHTIYCGRKLKRPLSKSNEPSKWIRGNNNKRQSWSADPVAGQQKAAGRRDLSDQAFR